MKRFLPGCLVFCSLLLSSYVSAGVEHRIIGGQESQSGDWPTMSAIVYSPDGNSASLFQRQFCGGNLISSKWVLSAAHCFFRQDSLTDVWTKLDPADIRVAVGINDLRDQADELVVTNIITRDDYDPSDASSPNDIALLELSNAVSNSTMQITSNQVSEGNSSIVVGWGARQYDAFSTEPSDFPVILHEVAVPVVSNSTCNSQSSYNGLIVSSQLCAGFASGGKDSCGGDSGGPLMVLQNGEYRQAGIVSFGNGCALENFYGVYTRTSSFQNWIDEYVDEGFGAGAGSNSGTNSDSDDDGLGASFITVLLMALAFGARRIFRLAGGSRKS